MLGVSTMTLRRTIANQMNDSRKRAYSVFLVLLFCCSLLAGFGAGLASMKEDSNSEYFITENRAVAPLDVQTEYQGGQGTYSGGMGSMQGISAHPALYDTQYADSGVMFGKINDLSLLNLQAPAEYGIFLEEQIPNDHDNDGIPDLDDLDDDNDGIYDLLERFDGCFGTEPYDHDNDGQLDEFDLDDDNDGILEGPIDYEALELQGLDPRNVSTDRYVNSTTVHPWTEQQVGPGYLADQHPWDHDNDGVPDEDIDGSGPGSYDEDDDNDGRIDQFKWPCDFDGDSIQDYFDPDDDDDGVDDVDDLHPYNPDIDSAASSGILWDGYTLWNFNSYKMYSSNIDFVAWESAKTSGNESFTEIRDGDLDGDGIPNFLDPDTDGDNAPDSADTDDDNDNLLDMWDPDDDNDGIPDVCTNIDTNKDGLNDYLWIDTSPYEIPGKDNNSDGKIDCEIDYDSDSDNDRWRPFDQNYNAVWDWFDLDMGGNPNPDNPPNTQFNVSDIAYDLDNDGIENENDSYLMSKTSQLSSWNCPTLGSHHPSRLVLNPNYNGALSSSPECVTMRASYSGNNDWDNDGINNWDDVDDDGDGIPDIIDIDPDCDFDNDGDLNALNGSKYRDDGPNSIDSDIDGDGLENDIDWDDDNDGLADLYDPDDGNCGVVDFDNTDGFYTGWYPQSDGDTIDGTSDTQSYAEQVDDHWNMTFLTNPFNSIVINYNGFDGTTTPATSGSIPEMYWYLYSRWSPYNGGNDWDIDSDGDSLVNGLDTDQDGDGLPDWFDQDEGNDGQLDINDPKMGGTFGAGDCGWTGGQFASGFVCGYFYAAIYHMPLTGTSANFGVPYSTRPDPVFDQGGYNGANSNGNWTCATQCYQIQFNGQVVAAVDYDDVDHNRALFLTWLGLDLGIWQWLADVNADFFPNEVGADWFEDDVSSDNDGDGTNDTVDLDDDYDSIYDWNDVDDDNDGIWDYFEVDTDFDLDDDAGTLETNFFIGDNCNDNDDDGNDADVDEDGWYQPVWDKGIMSQGMYVPQYYDVDNDNDGVPDAEDLDDDNDGRLDVDQELLANCFTGEEGSPWDHDNDGVEDWKDDDWDADGRSNDDELLVSITAPFDHDNDGLRDDLDDDDDQDGMKDEDEVLLWPRRYNSRSTNPWDHDDFGGDDGIANPNDPNTGPDAIDNDDDNDTREDNDYDVLEEGYVVDPNSPWCASIIGSVSSDWDSDNDCVPDEDDKMLTTITLNTDTTLWLSEPNKPALFSGNVQYVPTGSTTLQPAYQLPVQVHILWKDNQTEAIETIDVLTDLNGNFTVGQFLYPEDIHVGDNTTYEVYAEVTEMFAFNGATSAIYDVGVKGNLTLDYTSWTFFRSDEQPLWLDFKTHYTSDWQRGIFDNKIIHSPITFTVSGGPFGNRSQPTQFDGFGQGFRADSNGWTSVSFVQENGSAGQWKQVRYNSTIDNGGGNLPGGYELVQWNDLTKEHEVQGRYNYTNTSMPPGDLEFVGTINTSLANEWPFPYLVDDETDPFKIRVMHRMFVEADMLIDGTTPVYWWNSTINNGDGTFGAWSTLFLEPSLLAAGLSFEDVRSFKPYPKLWDGNPASLQGEMVKIRPFISGNDTHWSIKMQNGGDDNLPPCGAIDPADPSSGVRCEIIPEMNTGDTVRVIGEISNRTRQPWTQDAVSLQLDLDGNGIFIGQQETAYTALPRLEGEDLANNDPGKAVFDVNWTWYPQYQAGTYGIRLDFTNSQYYYTGNLTTTLANTGAYVNLTVVGTTGFELTSIPNLYRNTTTFVEAKLIDNALQPVRDAPVNWTWSGQSGASGINYTNEFGVLKIPFDIPADHELGPADLTFEFFGNNLLRGTYAAQELWVSSQTFIYVETTSPNIMSTGDYWTFTAQVLDDNSTPGILDVSQNGLHGLDSPDGGLVDIIFEGVDFNDVYHRQVVATVYPNGGIITMPTELCLIDEKTHVLDPTTNILAEVSGQPDGFWDRDVGWLLDISDPSSRIGFQDGLLDRYNESTNCLKSNISPLNPNILSQDPTSFLYPDGFGPVNVILRFEESLPNEGCAPLIENNINNNGLWDPCLADPGSSHYRQVLKYDVNGFSLIGETTLSLDEQVVYTSEVDPFTGLVVEKPMIITGHLEDEMGKSLENRVVRVQYVLDTGSGEPEFCSPGLTDENGNYSIACPLEGVRSGKVTVTVTYNAPDNNDAFRYMSDDAEDVFSVFSNSTLEVTEVGPGKNSIATWVAPNGTVYPVLYFKEDYHIQAILKQSNGLPIGDCLNIYIDPLINTRPVAKAITNPETGMTNWYSADRDDNPSLQPIGQSGSNLEGFRTLRVAYEPDKEVSGGCDRDTDATVNGSYDDITVLIRSRVDMQVKDAWERFDVSGNGYREGDLVQGSVSILRDRLDLAIENEEVRFVIMYYDDEQQIWVDYDTISSYTNEQGVADFDWNFTGTSCGGKQCVGLWKAVAYFPGSMKFVESEYNITGEMQLNTKVAALETQSFLSPQVGLMFVIILLAASIVGTILYKRSQERRRVELLRGILADTMMQLQAANEYIAVIFNCYKQLVKHFRRYGWMKKVYETTREFEAAVMSAFYMVPANELAEFLSVFEEARYSDHSIGEGHRDRALHTLQAVTQSIDAALGEGQMINRTIESEASIHAQEIKAGQFKSADGSVIIQGQQEESGDGLSI